MEIHAVQIDKPSRKGYVCHFCCECFTTTNKFFQHKVTRHPEWVLQCSICFKVFQTEIVLNRHVESQHNEKAHEANSAVDSDKVQEGLVQNDHNKADNKKHFDKAHISTQMQRCKTCGMEFLLKNMLRAHILHKHPQVELFHCKFCVKVFERKVMLKTFDKEN